MASLRALLGLYPKTNEYETKRHKLEEEYKALIAVEESAELSRFYELNKYIHSGEFAQKKKEILSLRFQQTNDYQKEKEYRTLTKAKDIRLYYTIKESRQLIEFKETEKSNELKNYLKLDHFVHSLEFAQVKKEASSSGKEKFAKSDLAMTLQQYNQQKRSEKIRGYYKFITDKSCKDFESAINSGFSKTVAGLEKKINSVAFTEKKAKMSKAEFKISAEKRLVDELKSHKKSRTYKNYQKMANSPYKRFYDELHSSAEMETFEDMQKFITSDDFKRQKREIEKRNFKDTAEFRKLQEYEQFKKSVQIKTYFKFKDSKEHKNFQNLNGSARIKEYEKLKTYIESDKFIKNKSYYTQSPKKRWKESDEFALMLEFEQLRKSEKIRWYLKDKDAKRFSWLRVWSESFSDDFTASKLNTKKWMTSYYYGEELLKDSYSLSHDKHYITNGKNLDFGNSTLRIITKKETIKGKSWHPVHGFITREFGYTSGLVSTGKSFRQKYGTFEAKIKFHNSKQIQNAFWMVSKTIVPHIDVAKANGRIILGNVWGNAKDLKNVKRYTKSVGKSKLATDFYIYSLEWTSRRLVWKINGLEIAASSQGIPQEPMYLVFSAGLYKDLNIELPAQMEIDWVRCYQHIDFLK
jgi:hypothetical protein